MRARQMHLLQVLVSQTTSLTPALLDQIRDSWIYYFRSKLVKGLPETQKPIPGQEERAWEDVLRLADQDATWKSACMARDEKFEMHLTSLVRYSRSYMLKRTHWLSFCHGPVEAAHRAQGSQTRFCSPLIR